MGNNIQIFGRTFSDVSSITVNNTSSSAVKYVQEPIFEDITISQDYLAKQNTVVSNGIIFQTDETYPGTPVVIDNARYANIANGDLGQNGIGIKIELNRTYHCTGELKIEWSTREQEIYSIDSDFTPTGYNNPITLSNFSWEGIGTTTQTFNYMNLDFVSSSANGYKIFIRPTTGGSSMITKSGVLLDGSYYQISVISDGFNTINLNLSDNPKFQAIYKSLAYRSVLYSSAPGVSEWCNSLSSFTTQQFAGQPFSGDFTFNNIKTINYYAFGSVYVGIGTGNYNYFGLNFPSCSSILSAAFVANQYLQSVSFPECTAIGNSAFQNCSKLTTISFPECITIGSSAFQSCYSLTTISFPKCTTIGSYAFSSCYRLTTISFPECTSININAFYSCSSLTTISFPKCTTIGSYAFSGCYNLTTMSFPECTSINLNAFYGCTKLTSAYFPECTSIGGNVFYNCVRLTTISFPKCTYIDYQAFYFCSSLTSAYFPECSILSNNAFSGCSNLAIVSFPKCTTIANYTFNNCSKLESAYFMGSSIISLLGMQVFTNTPLSNSTYLGYYGSIYVPASLLASYKTATNWSAYSARIVGI